MLAEHTTQNIDGAIAATKAKNIFALNTQFNLVISVSASKDHFYA